MVASGRDSDVAIKTGRCDTPTATGMPEVDGLGGDHGR
jgi:hypothetical protein